MSDDVYERAVVASGVMMAGRANLIVFSGVIAALVKRGALTEFELVEFMGQEQEFIEELRLSDDPLIRLDAWHAAGWLERLNELLCRRLYGAGHKRSLLDEWRLDPADPCFPLGPANDED